MKLSNSLFLVIFFFFFGFGCLFHHSQATFLLYRLLNPYRLQNGHNHHNHQPTSGLFSSSYLTGGQRIQSNTPASRKQFLSPVRAGQRLKPQSQPIAVENYSSGNNVIESVPIDTSDVGFESNSEVGSNSMEFVNPSTGVQVQPPPSDSPFVYGPAPIDGSTSSSHFGMPSIITTTTHTAAEPPLNEYRQPLVSHEPDVSASGFQ